MNWLSVQRKLAPYLFVSPFFLGLLVFWAYPALYGLYLSFFRQTGLGQGTFVGLENYVKLFSDERFLRSLLNTTYYAAGSVFFIVPLALFVAIILQARFVRFKHLFRLAFFLPLITSSVVVAIMFVLIFEQRHGLLNTVLATLGLPAVPWLLDPALGVPTLILLGAWKWTGVNAVYFLVGLQNIPSDITEAAAIDGANRWQVFRHVVFPLLRPITLFVVVTAIFGSYKLFGEPYVLQGGGGGPSDSMLTMTIYLYLTGFRFLNIGYAAAIGYAMMIIMMVLSLLQLRLFGAFKED
ncbi:MAG TPA: sugar ABC transporter permease [Chloroflexota bacterium]